VKGEGGIFIHQGKEKEKDTLVFRGGGKVLKKKEYSGGGKKRKYPAKGK